MILYADEYQMLKYNRDNSLLEMNWTFATSKLKSKTYMNRINNMFYYVDREKPQNILANLEGLTYTGSAYVKPNLQKEIHERIANADVKRLAVIKSTDTVTQLLVDQFIKKVDKSKVLLKYFDNEEVAKEWLNQPLN